MSKKIFMFAFLALFVWASVGLADTDRLGTVGALELRLPIGARATALSGAVLADVSGPEALYWNPAGAAAGEGYEAMFSYGQWIADINLNYFGLTVTSGSFGTFGLSAKVLDIGEWEQTTTTQPEGTGVMVDPNFWVLGLSYAKQMTDRVAFGTTFNYISENVKNTSATGFALDFGFQYSTPVQGLDFGIVLKSIGPDMRFDGSDFEKKEVLSGADPGSIPASLRLRSASFEIPSTILFGISYQAMQADMYSLNLTSDAQLNNHSDDEFRFGGEFAYNEMFFLRGGYVASAQDEYLFTGTFGAGLNLKMGNSDLKFDYSYIPVSDYFDDQSWFSVKVGF
jgi:hypothetical protein